MGKITAVVNHIRNRQFDNIQAYLPSYLRYVTSRQLWMFFRLGMYKTVVSKSPLFISSRAHVVKFLSRMKRQSLSQTHTQQELVSLLQCNINNKKLFKEIVYETVTQQPEVILSFLQNHHQCITNDYFKGLYVALLMDNNQGQLNDVNLAHIGISSLFDGHCLLSNQVGKSSREKLELLNQSLSGYGLINICLKKEEKGFFLNNIVTLNNTVMQTNMHCAKVSVLVTTHNSQETICYCLDSLKQQTWLNIEIIVIDDASKDNTPKLILQYTKQDSRIKPILLSKNTGTFAAKSIGETHATGEFITCHDSDDWAHPQKIEKQIIPLIKNKDLIATTSSWYRIDQFGQYYVRQYYPFLRQNPASPLFRRAVVKQRIGLWHIVRTGSDSEFYERLKAVYGRQAIKHIKMPLTLASHRDDSLMNSKKYGIHDVASKLNRLDYWEAWRLWHIDSLYQSKNIYMPTLLEQTHLQQDIFLGIPKAIKVDRDKLYKNLQSICK